MRRLLVVLALLLVALVVGDQLLRLRIEREVEAAAASGFSAAEADADVAGLLVVPQLLTGTLDRIDVVLGDAVIGDPTIRVTRLHAELREVTAGLRPAALERVRVAAGTIEVSIHEREVERLLRRERPGWSVRVTADGVIATGQVQGADVEVTAEVLVEGAALRFQPRGVDAGALGPGAARAVAGAFATTVPLSGLPAGVEVIGARPVPGHLVVTARLTGGVLELG